MNIDKNEVGFKLDNVIRAIQELKEAFGIAPPDVSTADFDLSTPKMELATPELITLDPGKIPPWIFAARQYEGLMEADDRDILEPFLGINPDDKAGGLSWCAAFVNAVLKECDIEGTGSNLADSFANWGQECELMDCCIAVFGPGKIPGNHAGFVVKDRIKILGGNQGDMVRENNLKYYLDNKTLLGYRWPPGYAIPTTSTA